MFIIVFLSAVLLYFLFRRRESFVDIPPPLTAMTSSDITQVQNYITKYLIPAYKFIRPKLAEKPEITFIDYFLAGITQTSSPDQYSNFIKSLNEGLKNQSNEVISILLPGVSLILNTLFRYSGFSKRVAPFQFSPKSPFVFRTSSLLPAGTLMSSADYKKLDTYLANIVDKLRSLRDSSNTNSDIEDITKMIQGINSILPIKENINQKLKPLMEQIMIPRVDRLLDPDILNYISREDLQVIIQRLISQLVNPVLQDNNVPFKLDKFRFGR
jgi:hypothetical protein